MSLLFQFELVHQDRVNRGEFAGVDAKEVDPLGGEQRQVSRFRSP